VATQPTSEETTARTGSIATDVGAIATDIAPAVESPPAVANQPSVLASRLTSLAVASGLFMEFIDSTALSTALPSMAIAFHSDPAHLKLALTSYLLALAVFAPASGWVADRFGAKRVFLIAIGVFLIGSAWCGLSNSLPELVAARVLQGAGGALMTPVGRLILVGATPRAQLVSAMTWFSTPALVGPLLGPPLAGLILGVADWRWIFFINLPVGLLGMAAVVAFVPKLRAALPGRFDTLGFTLTAVGITALVVFAETIGEGVVPRFAQAALGLLAAGSLGVYVRHALRIDQPILNLRLLRVASFRASLVGGSLVRLGLGATPFLLPLLLQVALGWSPAKAGLVSIATAIGALSCKPVAPGLLRRYGFRQVLLWSVIGTALLTAIPALYGETTPLVFMVVTLGIGGFVRSMQFTSANTIAYADIEQREVSQASTLATVAQQIGMSFGISFGALLLHLARNGDGALTPARFVLPFVVIGAVTLLAAPVYWRLNPQAGASISGRPAAAH
jgi:EmrB/QacA subfamily drug resistance transporter